LRYVTPRFALLVFLSLAVGCSSTKLVESWSAPGVDASDLSFQHVVAIAVLSDVSRQRIAEDALAGEATDTKVTAAYTILSKRDRADTERLRAVLEKNGIDGAITVRLTGVEDKQTYVPGTTRVVGGGYYGYYGRVGTVVHEPGYVRTDTYVRVETTLFDVAAGKLLWSGLSETMNPDSVGEVIEGIVRAASKDLKKRGLVP